MSRKQKTPRPNHNAVIDVVITTSGRFDMLRKCLDALEREAGKTAISVYLIDNNSVLEERRANEDLFVKREGSQFCEFKTKRLSQDTGFPASNNEGARMGNSPYIMFLNDDVELHEDAVLNLLQPFQEPNIGIVGIKLLFPPSSTSPIRPAGKVQHVGIGFNIRGEPLHPLVGWSPDHPKANVSRDVIAVTGACMTVRRTVFSRVGGFSLEFGMGTWEDVDLCFKARMAGFRTWITTSATGYHFTGATQEKKRVAYPLAQNRNTFQVKWGNTGMMMHTDWEFL